jgi:hypothetical protein
MKPQGQLKQALSRSWARRSLPSGAAGTLCASTRPRGLQPGRPAMKYQPVRHERERCYPMPVADTDLLDFCDHYLQRKEAGRTDPVPVPRVRPAVSKALLD